MTKETTNDWEIELPIKIDESVIVSEHLDRESHFLPKSTVAFFFPTSWSLHGGSVTHRGVACPKYAFCKEKKKKKRIGKEVCWDTAEMTHIGATRYGFTKMLLRLLVLDWRGKGDGGCS